MGETGIRFFNNLRCVALRCVALRCVALRCVALHCVALRCVAESFCLQIKSSKKQNILGKCARKARNFGESKQVDTNKIQALNLKLESEKMKGNKKGSLSKFLATPSGFEPLLAA